MKTSTILAIAATTTSTTQAFTATTNNNAVVVRTQQQQTTALNMGLFDGVKEAFGADGMGDLDAERETPIDRWMGWNTKKDDSQGEVSKAPVDFIDSMDEKNYVTVTLPKPMGIVFEENDSEFGGIFVLEISEGSAAETEGTIRPGDQLVAVGTSKVSGLAFEEALGTIIDSQDEKTKLVFFRGPSKFLYGPAGASAEWLDEFVAGGKKVESTA